MFEVRSTLTYSQGSRSNPPRRLCPAETSLPFPLPLRQYAKTRDSFRRSGVGCCDAVIRSNAQRGSTPVATARVDAAVIAERCDLNAVNSNQITQSY